LPLTTRHVKGGTWRAPGILGPDFWPGILARDLARGFPRAAAAPAGALPRAPLGAVSRVRFWARFGGRFRARFWDRSAGRLLPACPAVAAAVLPTTGGACRPLQSGYWAWLFPGRLTPDAVGVGAVALPALRKATPWRRPWPLLGADLAAVGRACRVDGLGRHAVPGRGRGSRPGAGAGPGPADSASAIYR
jgi:hypothetical protein